MSEFGLGLSQTGSIMQENENRRLPYQSVAYNKGLVTAGLRFTRPK